VKVWIGLIGFVFFASLSGIGQTTDSSPETHAPQNGSLLKATQSGMNVFGFEILNKINAKDLGTTYEENLLLKVRRKWDRLISQADAEKLPRGITLIEVTIKKEGSEENVGTAESSGNQSLDAMAVQAVASAEPFGPFPPELHEEELKLRYHFGFNQPLSAAAPVCGEFHPAGKPVISASGPVKPPSPKFMPDPEYSDQARRAKYQGMVIVGGVVDETGALRDVCLRQGAGQGLDEKAIETVKSWKFEPANREGEPVAVYIEMSVSFRLY
jgi:TonB family protein